MIYKKDTKSDQTNSQAYDKFMPVASPMSKIMRSKHSCKNIDSSSSISISSQNYKNIVKVTPGKLDIQILEPEHDNVSLPGSSTCAQSDYVPDEIIIEKTEEDEQID